MRIVPKCPKMTQNVPKCPKTSQNVPKCPKMSNSDASLSDRTRYRATNLRFLPHHHLHCVNESNEDQNTDQNDFSQPRDYREGDLDLGSDFVVHFKDEFGFRDDFLLRPSIQRRIDGAEFLFELSAQLFRVRFPVIEERKPFIPGQT